ncbi:MAG: alpha/beta fold hydrolase, partial [Candidatus Heimdallarchaeota archaeon]
MPYVESFDGSNIYYEMKGEGTPIILLPCVGATLDYWKYQEPLSTKYNLVSIDTAGVGKSDKSRKEYPYSSLAQDVKAVIDKEQLEKVIIVGHSFGGVIALETAIILQEKIAGIIVIDSLIPKTEYYGLKATEEQIAEEMKFYEGNYQDNYDNLLRNM